MLLQQPDVPTIRVALSAASPMQSVLRGGRLEMRVEVRAHPPIPGLEPGPQGRLVAMDLELLETALELLDSWRGAARAPERRAMEEIVLERVGALLCEGVFSADQRDALARHVGGGGGCRVTLEVGDLRLDGLPWEQLSVPVGGRWIALGLAEGLRVVRGPSPMEGPRLGGARLEPSPSLIPAGSMNVVVVPGQAGSRAAWEAALGGMSEPIRQEWAALWPGAGAGLEDRHLNWSRDLAAMRRALAPALERGTASVEVLGAGAPSDLAGPEVDVSLGGAAPVGDTLALLRERLGDGRSPVNVLQVECHGLRDPAGGGLRLVLSRADGGPQCVDADELMEVLRPYREALRLIVLSCCEGGLGGEEPASGGGWFRPGEPALRISLAGQLAREGFPAVIAFRSRVSLDVLHATARHLYLELARAPTPSLEEAVQRTRRALWERDPATPPGLLSLFVADSRRHTRLFSLGGASG